MLLGALISLRDCFYAVLRCFAKFTGQSHITYSRLSAHNTDIEQEGQGGAIFQKSRRNFKGGGGGFFKIIGGGF
jgi:hypothetical protein